MEHPPRKRLPHYERTSDEPPKMVFTPRDKQILTAIHEFEGILSDHQIQRLFFESQRRMKARMSLLYHNGYVDRFTRQQQNAYGFMAYFLDEQGIDYLCNQRGIEPGELNPRRRVERQSLIRHDVILNDVRIALVEALAKHPQAELMEWVSARTFARDYDTITYPDGRGQRKKRNMIPDGYCHIKSGERHSHLLLEVDLRTETNRRFVEEKVRPGIYYLASEEYQRRFGTDRGRWLVVTTGERRLENMKRQAEAVGEAARVFFYTTLEEAMRPGAFFTEPIWRRPTFATPIALWSEKASHSP